MSALILPRRFYSQPHGRYEVADDSVLIATVGGARNFVKNTRISFSPDLGDSVVTEHGLAHSNLQTAALTYNQTQIIRPPLTIFALVKVLSIHASGSRYAAGFYASGDEINFRNTPFLWSATLRRNFTGPNITTESSGPAAPSADMWYFLAFTSASDVSHRFDVWRSDGGYEFGTSTTSVASVSFQDAMPFYLGHEGCHAVPVYAALDRYVDAQELLSLRDNPWQLFRANPVRLYFDVPAVGGDSVTSDLSDEYIVKSLINSDLIDSYQLRATVVSNIEDEYSVRSIINNDLVDNYYLKNLVNNDLNDECFVRAIANSDFTDSYYVRGKIYSDLTDEYDIETTGSVVSQLSDSYNIRSIIHTDLYDQYRIAISVINSLEDTYSLRSFISGDLNDSYPITASVYSDITGSHIVRDKITSDISDSYNVGDIIVPPCPSVEEIADAVWGHTIANDLLSGSTICQRILRNKTVTDPVTGVMTVYNDDGVTPYLTAQLYEDASESQKYRGQGAEVRERLV